MSLIESRLLKVRISCSSLVLYWERMSQAVLTIDRLKIKEIVIVWIILDIGISVMHESYKLETYFVTLQW